MSEKQVAEPQFRFFTSERLRAGAKSSAQIATMIRNGALVPIGRGVYVSPAVAREFAAVLHGDHILRAAAALVRNGPACAVSHQSAALLHRIDLIGEDVSEVTITTRNGGRRGHRHSVHTYSNGLSDAHITHKFGLPVTTAARTVADLARTLPYAEGVVAADSVLHHGLATAAELWQLAAEMRLRRGGYRVNRVVHFADARAESPLESLARVIFDEAGLPPPDLQVPITSADGQFIGRVDFLWPEHKLIVEVDGAAKYREDPGRARAQLWRDKALRRVGYEVLHFDWREVTNGADDVTAAVWAELRARGGQGHPAA
jgi:predicted transcriptional regulator of viral defense system